MAEQVGVLKHIKGAEVHTPEYLSTRDVFIASDQVASIRERIELTGNMDAADR